MNPFDRLVVRGQQDRPVGHGSAETAVGEPVGLEILFELSRPSPAQEVDEFLPDMAAAVLRLTEALTVQRPWGQRAVGQRRRSAQPFAEQGIDDPPAAVQSIDQAAALEALQGSWHA